MRLVHIVCFVCVLSAKISNHLPSVNFSSIKFIKALKAGYLSEAERKILQLLLAAVKCNLFMCGYGSELDCYIEMFSVFPIKESVRYFLKLRTVLKGKSHTKVFKFTFTNLKKDTALSEFINSSEMNEEMIIQLAENLSKKVLSRFSTVFKGKGCSVFDNSKFFIDNFEELLFINDDDNNVSKKKSSKDFKENNKTPIQDYILNDNDNLGPEAYCENNSPLANVESESSFSIKNSDEKFDEPFISDLQQNNVQDYFRNSFNTGYPLESKINL